MKANAKMWTSKQSVFCSALCSAASLNMDRRGCHLCPLLSSSSLPPTRYVHIGQIVAIQRAIRPYTGPVAMGPGLTCLCEACGEAQRGGRQACVEVSISLVRRLSFWGAPNPMPSRTTYLQSYNHKRQRRGEGQLSNFESGRQIRDNFMRRNTSWQRIIALQPRPLFVLKIEATAKNGTQYIYMRHPYCTDCIFCIFSGVFSIELICTGDS